MIAKLADLTGKDWYAWFLPAAFIFLLPFESLLYAPLVIMAIIGLITILKKGNFLSCRSKPAYKLLVIVFALIWLPMVVSLTDAVNLAHSFKTTISVLPYILVGFYIIYFLNSQETRNKLNIAILCITTFWCIDALYQLFFSVNLFGDTYIVKNRISGIFYPKLTLGLVLAVLLPVVLEQSRRMAVNYKGIIFAILIASLHISIIILSGSRTALLILSLGLISWFVYVLFQNRNLNMKKAILAIAIGLPIIGALTYLQPTRFDTLVDIPEADLRTIDKISSFRFPLWEASFQMARDHWINGIGPRGFRYAYNDYRPEKGKYIHEFKKASTHPHFALLEIFTETGIIGFTGVLLFLVLIFINLQKIEVHKRMDVYPWYLGVVLAIVPNIAKAFYSTSWLSIVFCMLFVGIANTVGTHDQV